MGDPVVAGVDFVEDVQIPTIASASLTAAYGQILHTVGSAAASARFPHGERRRRSNC